jgi:hypothetical protein
VGEREGVDGMGVRRVQVGERKDASLGEKKNVKVGESKRVS